MGIMVEAFADDSGMRWTETINPADVHIVPIAKSTEDESYIQAVALYDRIAAEGRTAIFDDRLHLSVGARLADADLIGCPKRVVISPKTLDADGAEVKDRITGDVSIVPVGTV